MMRAKKMSQMTKDEADRECYRALLISFVSTDESYDGLNREKLTELFLAHVAKRVNELYDL